MRTEQRIDYWMQNISTNSNILGILFSFIKRFGNGLINFFFYSLLPSYTHSQVLNSGIRFHFRFWCSTLSKRSHATNIKCQKHTQTHTRISKKMRSLRLEFLIKSTSIWNGLCIQFLHFCTVFDFPVSLIWNRSERARARIIVHQ